MTRVCVQDCYDFALQAGLAHCFATMTLRERIEALKRDTLALYLAMRDPRTPRRARWLAALVVAYAFSPIDLIPDFIPVLGLLDDLLLLPLGIALCLRWIPPEVLADARARAATIIAQPTHRGAAIAIVLLWIAAAGLALWWVTRLNRA
jgi:uncharacterized membrane protein YkvA (DUF1232 family)